jgi:hypothetical protein
VRSRSPLPPISIEAQNPEGHAWYPKAGSVQSQYILYRLSRDILYTPRGE